MTARQISDGNDDGQVLGQSATDKVAFHGATPVAQASAITLASAATVATTNAAVQDIITALTNKGLLAS